MEKLIPTSIRLPESLRHELDALAKADKRSLNNYIVLILQEYADGKRKNVE